MWTDEADGIVGENQEDEEMKTLNTSKKNPLKNDKYKVHYIFSGAAGID